MIEYKPVVKKGINGRDYTRQIPVAGFKYGDIVLTGGFEVRGRATYVEATCICGNNFMVRKGNLKNGKTKSCGCLSNLLKLMACTKHGLCGSRIDNRHPIYNTWAAIKSRCYNSNYPQFHNYGGRGISVCQSWFDNFLEFYNWAINNGWQKGLTLERVNVNGDYEPSNCTWITNKEQSKNKTNSRFLEAFGEIKIHADWERDERCKVSISTFKKRLKKGWTPEDALTKIIAA